MTRTPATTPVKEAVAAIVSRLTGAYHLQNVIAALENEGIPHRRTTVAWALSQFAQDGTIRRLSTGWYATNDNTCLHCEYAEDCAARTLAECVFYDGPPPSMNAQSLELAGTYSPPRGLIILAQRRKPMLTENQKEQIAEIAAAREARLAEEQLRREEEIAARRAENLGHWQPVLAAAAAIIPDWLADGLRFAPGTTAPDLDERWLGLLKSTSDCNGWHASVYAYTADGNHVMTLTLERRAGCWEKARSDYAYRIVEGDGSGTVAYENLELALLRLAQEDDKRAAFEAEQAADAESHAAYQEELDREAADYAARRAAIAEQQATAKSAREKLEREIAALVACADASINNAASVAPHRDGSENTTAMFVHLAFSLAQSYAAIARILNDWHRHYEERNAF